MYSHAFRVNSAHIVRLSIRITVTTISKVAVPNIRRQRVKPRRMRESIVRQQQ